MLNRAFSKTLSGLFSPRTPRGNKPYTLSVPNRTPTRAIFTTTRPLFPFTRPLNPTTLKTQPNRQPLRLFSTQQPQQILLPPAPKGPSGYPNINFDRYPQLKNLQPTRQQANQFTTKLWSITKVGLCIYFFAAVCVTWGSRLLAGTMRQYLNNAGIVDIEKNGSVSVWYLPLLYQDRQFIAHFDPKYPSLNHYYFRVFVMKEFEAATRAADGIYENGSTLMTNSTLRVKLLKKVLKQGWASQSELTVLFDAKDGFRTRQLNDGENIILSESTSRIREEYEAIMADQNLSYEERLQAQFDPRYQISDRIDLSKQQLLYIQQGIDEFEKLTNVGVALRELALQLRASNITTLFRLHRPAQDWSFSFDHLSNEYHQIMATAAATAKLNDAIYVLSTQNLDQILHFMRNFDKTIQLLNSPEQIKKNKFQLPVFPKLTFDVITTTEYAAQLATYQSHFRTVHDPLYDSANPSTILSGTGEILNPTEHEDPKAIARNRDYIPYTSPGRPYNLPHDKDLDFLRAKYVLDPTYEQEIEHSQNLFKLLRTDQLSDALQTIQQLRLGWTKDNMEMDENKRREGLIKKEIEYLAQLASGKE